MIGGNVSNMAECHTVREQLTLTNLSFDQHSRVRILRKYKKNRLRLLRRKRSKLKYWQYRRQLKLHRQSNDLCRSTAIIDITDMDMGVQQSDVPFLQPIQEVSTWHQQHQLAYWKSRAIALQMENRMLRHHLRNVYVQQINDYVLYQNDDEIEDRYDSGSDRQYNKHETKTKNAKYNRKKSKRTDFNNEEFELNMKQSGKEKKEAAAALYGEMAPRINGMETAIQLQYDSYMDQHRPQFWPNIPLNL